MSICIPVYNGGMYIQDTLFCICNQTYCNIEIIVVNDGSTDDTLFKIAGINDDRIKTITVKNGGAASARNMAYKNSSGAYIIFFDADDLVEENFIATQIECLSNDLNSVVLSPWSRFYSKPNLSTSIDIDIIPKDMLFKKWIINYWSIDKHTTPPGRVLIPRILIEKAGLWDEALSLNDDLEFFTRIFSVANKIRYNKSSRFFYRSDVNGLSSIKGETAAESHLKSIEQSITIALKIFPDDKDISISCSGLLQGFIYKYYPLYPKLRLQALTRIKILGKSELKFECGGKTAVLVKIFGWKITRRIKYLGEAFSLKEGF